MDNFQVIAYNTKKSDKRYWSILCIFAFLLLPITIYEKNIFQAVTFGFVALCCTICIILQYLEPKEKIKISSDAIQLCYLTKTITIKFSNIDKIDYECVCSYKHHTPVYEKYGSVKIQEGGKKHYITEIEDVKNVYEVITNYKGNNISK